MEEPSCFDPSHVQGTNIRGCIVCSIPVCEACIIKASFRQRNDSAFANRSRSLCSDCYRVKTQDKHESPPLDSPVPLCKCTAKDGHICRNCRIKQSLSSQADLERCHGEDCSKTKAGGFPSKICLWCQLCLPSDRSRALTRREYNSRHLLARSLSTCEHDIEYEIIEAVKLESLQVPLPRQRIPPKLASFEEQRSILDPRRIRRFYDPYEIERQRQLGEVSARRSHTMAFAEEERWTRSEQLRRHDASFHTPPSIRRRATYSVKQNSEWQDTDSLAPTLVDRDFQEDSEPLDCHVREKKLK